LQCDIEQRDGDGESIAECEHQRERFDELVHRVFERTDVDLVGEQLQRDGAVPVVPEQRCNRWRDEFELHGAGRPECWDVRVHAGCDVWQLQRDIEQRDSDGEPSADGDNQREWLDEPVCRIFERPDVDIIGEQLQRDSAVPVVPEQRCNRWCDRFELHSAFRPECRDVHVHACCHVRQL